ncbi:MAG: ABC transporter permease [Bryobacterales bacterium]|nr:ABC transporter permease [Bryobacteraceae bacterium]MDW8354250.1 ABC transporter permease [Bryobacterales bacterium]
MAIPLAYNWRNLVVRKATTLMTALGIALTVAVLVAVLALIEGLRRAFEATGNPLHVLVLRKGSDSELVSNFTRAMYQDLKFKPGIARSRTGEPMASLEMVTVINLPRVDSPEGMNVTLRGLLPIGIEMREEVRLVAGRWFEFGKREVVVGKSIAARFPGAELGKQLEFGRGRWTVVGIMDAGRGVANSEIFADLNQLSADYNRAEVLSSALVRAVDSVAAQALINDLSSDRRLNVTALSERDYYERQKISGAPIQYIGTLVALIMAVGSSFAAMNTMYAAVARRAREIGTLRVLGFSRLSILASFLVESVLLSLLGGVLGVLLVLPLDGMTTGIGNFVTFSEIAFDFHLGPSSLISGLLFAVAMGALGGVFPAAVAARKEILTALREY